MGKILVGVGLGVGCFFSFFFWSVESQENNSQKDMKFRNKYPRSRQNSTIVICLTCFFPIFIQLLFRQNKIKIDIKPRNYYFSVFIPFNNRQRYIKRAVNSVLKQTFQNFEIVFVDDASTDNTSSIVKEYCSHDNRLSLYSLPQRTDTNFVRMYGVSQTRGKFVVSLDSDDYIYPSLLNDLYNANLEDQHDIICFDAIMYVNKSYHPIWNFRLPRKRHFNRTELLYEIRSNQIGWNLIFLSIRRTIYMKAIELFKPFLTSDRICVMEDRLHAHVAFLYCNSFYYLHKVEYIYYRDHETTVSRKNMLACNGSGFAFRILIAILKNYSRKLPPNYYS